jgi:esterase/lipase
MLSYKEFYVWLDGFMTNRDWTTIKQVDIESIQKKMKEVKDENEFDLEKFSKFSKTRQQYFNPISVPLKTKDDDDLGKPPRIVM